MKSPLVRIVVLLVLLIVTALLSLGVGAVPIPPDRVVRILGDRDNPANLLTQVTIIWELRLPRILLGCIVGVALGTAGAGYQGLFRNPLADPFVIGASSG